MTAPQNSAAVTDVAFHSTHRKGYQSKLLVVLSKGGRCNFWGLLDCDDRRSPWWASRVWPQLDTVMISMDFNGYASLAIFFLSPYCFFYFVFEHETIIYYKRVSCVWFLLPYVKTFKTRTVHFVYSLRIFVSAHVIITSITVCLQTFVRFFCCICRLACSEISLSIKEKKKLRKSPRESRT